LVWLHQRLSGRPGCCLCRVQIASVLGNSHAHRGGGGGILGGAKAHSQATRGGGDSGGEGRGSFWTPKACLLHLSLAVHLDITEHPPSPLLTWGGYINMWTVPTHRHTPLWVRNALSKGALFKEDADCWSVCCSFRQRRRGEAFFKMKLA
jgi:hypothetical protein